MKRTVDLWILPALSALVAVLGILLPDYLGFGASGLGSSQKALLMGCGFAAVLSLLLRFRPFGFAQACLKRPAESALFITVLIGSLIAMDVLLRHLLPPVYQQSRYGWSMKSDFIRHAEVRDSRKEIRKVTNQYYEYGFKRWGNPETKKKKILILGDSFTEMNWVLNGEEWYAYVEKEFPSAEFFVFGGGGYGTLQQALILDDHLETIKPDFIVWQFCNNDYGNNLYELDVSLYPFNNHGFRPYLENGEITYRLPVPLHELRKHSFIAARILVLWDRLMWRMVTKDIEDYLARRELRSKELSASGREAKERLMEESVKVTRQIFRQVRNKIGDIPLLLFNPCAPVSEHEMAICLENDFICLPGVYESVDAYKQQGEEVSAVNDGHWNKRGNELAGRIIASSLKAKTELQTMV